MLEPGLKHSLSLPVTHAQTVPALSQSLQGFADMPPVFATAFMVGFIEWACIEALHPHLPDDAITLGTHVDVSHCAPTPVGLTVTAHVELLSVEGRCLRFRVSCRDDFHLIGEGFHERHIVDRHAFAARIDAKRNRRASAVAHS